MPPIGPQPAPTGPEKRKLEDDDLDSSHTSDSESDIGPAPPQTKDRSPKRPRFIGPSMPSTADTLNIAGPQQGGKERQISNEQSSSRTNDENNSDDSDDDDFGPSLPPTEQSPSYVQTQQPTSAQTTANTGTTTTSKRDDWMMVPPSGGDWSARVDPTKLKNRKFNTGKGAKGPSGAGDASSTWHETPAEKQARLQREMMGIKDSSVNSKSTSSDQAATEDAETARRMAEYSKSRGPTLYAAHQKTQTEEEDDPSARTFDREKDIGGGLQINSTKRKEMLKNASNLGSRFSNARYL